MDNFSFFKHAWPRNINSTDFLETFLISAISAILIIRTYLTLTGFPQIGLKSLHVAHMLWGGLLMAIAIVLVLTFFGKTVQRLGAVLGGIGFGTFIDELGKVITKDNNYFFRPTIALIYVVFILFYLLIQYFEKNRRMTKTEYLVNALELTKEIFISDLDREEKEKAVEFLKRTDSKDPLVKTLKELLDEVEVKNDSELTFFSKVKTFFRKLYEKLIHSKWFNIFLISFFVIQALIAITKSSELVIDVINNVGALDLSQEFPQITFLNIGEAFFTIISDAFILIGVFLLPKSRLVAYQMFKRALLISIFITQFFLFYKEQLTAIFGLTVNILVLIAVEYMITREERRAKD